MPEEHHPPSHRTGAAAEWSDGEDTVDCPWCDALLEASLPPTAPPSKPPGRRHDPYVSGTPYDGDDW
ncbi:hypothetical protein [Streptomyces sp. KS_5]|uniref:hypothetical protein n=1 Tax=Streptomyces sp. KS_5 TaxID=1881018 RepID=UPI00115FBC86|nr:hypothetical protein [Streptomyces sp. KS_5]